MKGSPRSRANPMIANHMNYGGTRQYLRSAFNLLRSEAPGEYAAVADCIQRAPGEYVIGPEAFCLTASAGRIIMTASGQVAQAKVNLEISPLAVLQLVDGAATLEELVASNVLRITADPEALLALHDAVLLLMRAAIRSHTLQCQFEKYREWVISSTKPTGSSSSVRIFRRRKDVGSYSAAF